MRVVVVLALCVVAVLAESPLQRDLSMIQKDLAKLKGESFLATSSAQCSGTLEGKAASGSCMRGCDDGHVIADGECSNAALACCADMPETFDDAAREEGDVVACASNWSSGICSTSCQRASVIWQPNNNPCLDDEICCKSSGDDDASSTTDGRTPVQKSAEQRRAALPFQNCQIEASTTCGKRYSHGQDLGELQCVKQQGLNIGVGIICPLRAMISAARSAGVTLSLNSGFRTMKEQQDLYKRNCNNGKRKCSPATAPPGTSNHQNGIAVDISTNSNPAAYTWLRANAHRFGFIRAVASETWHWEYHPGFACNAIVKVNRPRKAKSSPYTCTNSPHQGV